MAADVGTRAPTVVAQIDQMAASSPQNVAVHSLDGTLTYAELIVCAERLAQHLRQVGVKPGELIGLCVERSARLVVAGLAIFMANGAYVAIDPRYPDERIRWMLDDSGASAVVCDAGTVDRLGTSGDRPSVVVAGGGALRDCALRDCAVTNSGEPLRRRPQPTDPRFAVGSEVLSPQPALVGVQSYFMAAVCNRLLGLGGGPERLPASGSVPPH